MALTKSHRSITQLTNTGTSTELDVSDSYSHTLYVRHSNGANSVTTVALIVVKAKPSGGTYTALPAFSPSKVTAQADDWLIPLPGDAASVEIDYTAPSGPDGFTLDAEVGIVTAL